MQHGSQVHNTSIILPSDCCLYDVHVPRAIMHVMPSGADTDVTLFLYVSLDPTPKSLHAKVSK